MLSGTQSQLTNHIHMKTQKEKKNKLQAARLTIKMASQPHSEISDYGQISHRN